MSNNNTNNIFWLASYPKSGNTWFRIFLSNFLSGEKMPLNINSIGHGQYPNNRQNFDALNGFSSTDLSLDEINRIRPIGLEWLSHNTDNTLFFKTHAAYTHNPDQTPVLGSTKTGIAGSTKNHL